MIFHWYEIPIIRWNFSLNLTQQMIESSKPKVLKVTLFAAALISHKRKFFKLERRTDLVLLLCKSFIVGCGTYTTKVFYSFLRQFQWVVKKFLSSTNEQLNYTKFILSFGDDFIPNSNQIHLFIIAHEIVAFVIKVNVVTFPLGEIEVGNMEWY